MRELPCGFEGDEDAYGMGIRLGVYLQWFATWLVSTVLHDEERGLMATSVVFSASLMVAVLVLTFTQGCTYSVEIIIMLYIIVMTLFLASATKTARDMSDLIEKHESSDPRHSLTPMSRTARVSSFLVSPDHSKGIRGWVSSTGVLESLVMGYTCWFWVRRAVGTDTTFAETPCGTSFFLFARIQSSAIPIASGFICVFCFLLLILDFLGWILRKIFRPSLAESIEVVVILIIFLPIGVSVLVCLVYVMIRDRVSSGTDTDSTFVSYWDKLGQV